MSTRWMVIGMGALAACGGSPDGPADCDVVATQLSEAAGETGSVTVAASDDGFGVVWVDTREGNPELYFAAVDGAGAKVGDDVRITDAAGDSEAPALLWTGDHFVVAWHDDRDGNTEIYAARLSATGVKTGDDDVRITDDPGRSEFPSLAPHGDGVVIAWNDDRFVDLAILIVPLDAALTATRDAMSIAAGASPSIGWNGDHYLVAYNGADAGVGLSVLASGLSADLGPAGPETISDTEEGTAGNASVRANGDGFLVGYSRMPGAAGGVRVRAVTPSNVPDGDPETIAATGTGGRMDGDAIVWIDDGVHLGDLSSPDDAVELTNSSDAADAAVAVGDAGTLVAWRDGASETWIAFRCAP